MHTSLQKYFSQRVKNLFNQFLEFDLKGDTISMHDLRVEMKKLKSIIKFLRNIYPKQKLKKAAHLVRSVFQTAGEIREYQIIQNWLQKHQFAIIESEYLPAGTLELMIKDFIDNSEKYKDELKEIIGEISELVDSTNEILSEQYFSALNAEVEVLCRKNLPSTDWHGLRKLIKQRIYAYNWLAHENENDDSIFPFYNKLQETIGQWHDLEIVKDFFSKNRYTCRKT